MNGGASASQTAGDPSLIPLIKPARALAGRAGRRLSKLPVTPRLSRRSVTDPRDGRKVALKKMPNVFQNLVSCKRVFRELRMLCFFKHDNVMTGRWVRAALCTSDKGSLLVVFVSMQVLSALDILQPPQIDCFEEMYPFL